MPRRPQDDTLNLLATLGCDVAQGYYVGVPLHPSRLQEWFADRGGDITALRRAADEVSPSGQALPQVEVLAEHRLKRQSR